MRGEITLQNIPSMLGIAESHASVTPKTNHNFSDLPLNTFKLG